MGDLVRGVIALVREIFKPVQETVKKAHCFALTLWWTGLLLAIGSAVAIIAATRVSGILLVLAIIVACSSCCGASVLCWGSSQVIAYTATLRVVTSQADRAEQIIGYVENAQQQYTQMTGATLGGTGVEMKQAEGAANNV